MTEEDLLTMMTSTTRATYLLVALLISAIAAAAQPSGLYTEKESSEEAAAELAPPTTGVTGDQIFRELLHHNDLRNSELKHYSEMRTYEVKNPNWQAVRGRDRTDGLSGSSGRICYTLAANMWGSWRSTGSCQLGPYICLYIKDRAPGLPPRGL